MCCFIDVLLLIDESVQKCSNTILQICRKTILITVFFTVTKVGTGQEFDSNTYKTTKREYKTALVKAKKRANENFINSAENKSKAAWQVIKKESGMDLGSSRLLPMQQSSTSI